MKKQATKRTERLVPDLPVQNDQTVKGGSIIGNVVGSVVKAVLPTTL